MVQYKIDDGSIRVLYGSDEMVGVFLTVIDRRLEWQWGTSDETNIVGEEISPDGGGHYFSLCTGDYCIGEKVSRATMADFMGRYGVPKMRIDELLGLYNPCLKCTKSKKIRCPKCNWKFYCSEECQMAYKERHVHFCDIKVPKKQFKETDYQRSVYGVLLMPEKEAKPKFVEITVNFSTPQIDEYFHRERCSCPLQWGPDTDCSLLTGQSKIMFGGDEIEHRPIHMKNMLQFYYRDNFMNDGSKLNECVRKITDGKAAHRWAGPILVLKAERKYTYNPEERNFMNMKLEDCEDMIDFFLLYGK